MYLRVLAQYTLLTLMRSPIGSSKYWRYSNLQYKADNLNLLLSLELNIILPFQKVISVCSLLVSIKKLSLYMWPDDDEKLDQLRLSFVLRMLKSPHFNARYCFSSRDFHAQFFYIVFVFWGQTFYFYEMNISCNITSNLVPFNFRINVLFILGK